MKNLIYAILLGSCAAAPVSAQQQGQAQCYPRETLVQALEKIGERRASQALSSQGLLTETWVAPNGAWTITVTGPNYVSCIVLHGQSWDVVEPKAEGVPG
jgi:hypothetical protein